MLQREQDPMQIYDNTSVVESLSYSTAMESLTKRHGSLDRMEDAMPASKMDDSRTLSPTSVQDVDVPEDNNAAKKIVVVDLLKQLVDSEARSTQDPFINSPAKTRTPPKHPMSSPVFKMPMTSPFRKQSEDIGNGWNAKGLQKATKQDWEGALQCFENALQVRIQVLGENHRVVANTMNNAGIAMGRLGREQEAMGHLEKALKIRTLLHGTNHADVAATLHNIGNVRQQMADYQGALESFTKAKRILAQLLGDSSVQVARAWNAIGHVHFEAHDFTGAHDAYTHAHDAFRRAGRPEDDIEVEQTKLDLEEAEQLLD